MNWKKIESLNCFYEASECGKIRSVSRLVRSNPKGTLFERRIKSKVLSQINNGNGYLYVTSSVLGKRKNSYVHRLVAECFVVNPLSLPEVNHINGDKSDNGAKNLEWVTSKENSKHAIDTGLAKSGVNHCSSKGVVVASKEGEIIYLFGKKHINESGFSSSCVYDCINKGVPNHKGYEFKRISNEDYLRATK